MVVLIRIIAIAMDSDVTCWQARDDEYLMFLNDSSPANLSCHFLILSVLKVRQYKVPLQGVKAMRFQQRTFARD